MDWAKKDCILVEAAKAFAKYGFKKTSIDHVAKKAGVAKGTVYNACDSKEDLFYQVLHREVRMWLAEISKRIDPRVPADEMLKMTSAYSEQYLDERPLVRDLLFREAHQLMPTWQTQLDELCDLGLANGVALLQLGIKQGVFRDDLDVEITAELLQDLSLAHYLLHDAKSEDREARKQRRRAAALDLVLNGIRRPEPDAS